MSARRRRVGLLVVIWILPAVLSFAVVRILGAGEDGAAEDRDRQGRPPTPTQVRAEPSRPIDNPAGPAFTLVGAGYRPGLTFQINEEKARSGPPTDVGDCRLFAQWAQENGAIPVTPEPVQTLSIQALRNVDVLIFSIRAKLVTEVVLTREQGPWVEVVCRDGSPGPTATVTDEGSPETGTTESEPYVLAAGQTVEMPVDLRTTPYSDEPFPSGVWDYYVEVVVEVDGVVETRELRNGSGYYRCCGRTTYMGYQAARYEWTLSPTRSVRHCAELRYTTEPPPAQCVITQR